MRILVDADGCPKLVKICCKEVAKEYDIPIKFYTTLAHFTDTKDNYVFLDCHSQSVDMLLANDTQKGDIVVTQDYGLASMILAKGGKPIGVRGEIFTTDNIDNFLLIRHQNAKLRKAKLLKGGPSKYSKEDLQRFKESLLAITTIFDVFRRKK